MSNIGRSSDDALSKQKPIEQLQKEYAAAKQEIKTFRDANPDRNKLTDRDTSKFRQLYLKAAELAKALSVRVTSDELRRGYTEDYHKLSEAAASYGSVIRSKVPETTFDDVKGLEDVKKLINTFIYIAQRDDLITHYRLDGGLGVLMYGPPGTGKTMIAEAIANAMQLPLFIVTPADIFKSYVGQSEQAVKEIFEEIESCADGAILFVDECESIFSRRTQDTKDYKSAVTTELLQRMNGFGVRGSKRVMLAATNRPDEMDPAYLRFKRFSHLVYIPLPDQTAVAAIVKKRLKGINLEGISEFEIVEMATRTGQLYSAADICGILEKSCMLAIDEIQQIRTENPIPITRAMIEKAFNEVKPRLTRADLAMYESFKSNIIK